MSGTVVKIFLLHYPGIFLSILNLQSITFKLPQSSLIFVIISLLSFVLPSVRIIELFELMSRLPDAFQDLCQDLHAALPQFCEG